MGVRFTTTRFGELDVPPDRIITFPSGLIGFGALRGFALVENPGGGPFKWLQSVERPELAFVITDPKLFFPDYAVEVKEEDLRRMSAFTEFIKTLDLEDLGREQGQNP